MPPAYEAHPQAVVAGALPPGQLQFDDPGRYLRPRVEAETAFRLREGPDWAADGVGIRFVAFEAGAEPEWIDYVAQQREAEKPERPTLGA